MTDIVLGRVSADAQIAKSEATWFHASEPSGPAHRSRAPRFGQSTRSMRASTTRPWPRNSPPGGSSVCAGWRAPALPVSAAKTRNRCHRLSGVHIIAAVRESFPECRFLAWTPGLDWPAIAGLRGLGFDAAFSSTPWWDGRASWFVEEHELLRGIGAVISCPEAPFGPRLARRFETSPALRAAYRHNLFRAVATGDGLMVPIGFEFATVDEMDRRGGAPDDLATANCKSGFAADIREANALTEQLASFGVVGEMRTLTDPEQLVTVLLRSDARDVRTARSSIAVVINTDLEHEHALPVSLDPLPPAAGGGLVAEEVIYCARAATAVLAGGEIRIVRALRSTPILLRRPDVRPVKLATLPRIVIDHVVPTVDDGRFAAKRVIGETVTVEADVFSDGHEVLAVELLWRAADESDWRRSQMQLLGNDRWQAAFVPDRIGRHEFTMEAWWDRYGTFCRDLELKRSAGVDIAIEIAEGRQILQQTKDRAQGAVEQNHCLSAELAARRLRRNRAPNSARARSARGDAGSRGAAVPYRREPAFPIDVERPQAAFARLVRAVPAIGNRHARPPRHLRRRDPPAAGDPGHGLRRALSAADPSDRN